MTALGTMIDRVKDWMRDPPLDTDSPYWLRQQMRLPMDDVLSSVARHGVFGNVMAVQAVANLSHYPLNEQSIFMTSGVVTSGVTSTTTLTDTLKDFVALGIAVDDRLRNLTDGSIGIVTGVATTVLTCDAGFTGGLLNLSTVYDQYLVERPLTQTTVVSIDAVLYNGADLRYATEETLERRQGPGWELRQTDPRYWTTQHTSDGTVLQIVPAPRFSGSSTLVVPPAPFPLPWQDNFVIFFREGPQQVLDETTTLAVTEAFEDYLVFATAASLSGEEGPYQDMAVAQTMQGLAQLWAKQLGIG